MRSRIANFGGFLCLLGVLSAVVQIGGCEMRLLRPLNDQPPTTAWGVRAGLIVVGALIFVIAGKTSPEESRAAAADQALIMQGMAQDPHMSYLLRYVYQTFGATLAAQPGAPRVAGMVFGGLQGYGRENRGMTHAYALVETSAGKFIASYTFAGNLLHAGPADESTWNSMLSL